MDQDVWNSAQDYLGQAARMAAAALVSAAVTATVVIAVGQSMIDRRAPQSATSDVIRISTRG
jgi:negative regulator of sigma E activity